MRPCCRTLKASTVVAPQQLFGQTSAPTHQRVFRGRTCRLSPRQMRRTPRRPRISTISARCRRSATCRRRCTPGSIRKERHGPPETSMQLEVVPTWPVGDDEVLVYVMAGGVNYNGVWAGARHPDLAARRPQESVSTSPARTRPAWSGRSDRRCAAGRSATRSSSTAIRTTATTRIATAATRCSHRRSASGATRRRTVRSPSSAACSRAS